MPEALTTTEDGAELTEAQALAQAIAPHLGEPWKFKEPGERSYWGEIEGAGGMELSISLRGYGAQAGKATISGHYRTRDAEGNHYSDRDAPPPIHVDSKRDPAAIAKDIARRLLPAYVAAFARHEKTIDEWNASIALTADTIRHIAAAVPTIAGRIGHDGKSLSIDLRGEDRAYMWGDLKASGEDVSFELRNIPRDVAVAMLRILAESRGTT
jgi:hypothetical protein